MKSTDILKQCVDVQTERGEEYGCEDGSERSFAAVAEIFNLKTGNSLKGSDICLILQDLKDVRQYTNPNEIHADSGVDKVSYASLHVEELYKELK